MASASQRIGLGHHPSTFKMSAATANTGMFPVTTRLDVLLRKGALFEVQGYLDWDGNENDVGTPDPSNWDWTLSAREDSRSPTPLLESTGVVGAEGTPEGISVFLGAVLDDESPGKMFYRIEIEPQVFEEIPAPLRQAFWTLTIGETGSSRYQTRLFEGAIQISPSASIQE